MTSQIYRLALSPWERGKLFAEGLWRFRPRDDIVRIGGRAHRRKKNSRYGLILGTARKFVAGDYGERTLEYVAQTLDISFDSLRFAVWKVNQAQKKKRAA